MMTKRRAVCAGAPLGPCTAMSRAFSRQFIATRRPSKFQADVTRMPIPRFDLLKFKDYLFMGVQFSRGCPFTCEF